MCDGCKVWHDAEVKAHDSAVKAGAQVIPAITPIDCQHAKDNELYRVGPKTSITDVGVIWNAAGGTRGYGRSSFGPKLEGINPGHEDVTNASIGASLSDLAACGIR